MKMKIKYDEPSLRNIHMEKEIKEYFVNKYKIYNKKYKLGRKMTHKIRKSNNINSVTVVEEIKYIKNNILLDVAECNEKKERDIIILIDLNIYDNKGEDILFSKTYKIDSFIEQTQLILNKYLSNNDRLCVLIFTDDYEIICPLMKVNKIDINSFSKDLIHYKNLFLNENVEIEEFEENTNEMKETNNNFDFNLGGNNSDEFISFEESSEFSEIEEKNYDKINVLVKTINYVNNYSSMKEQRKNEKYIILFTDLINLNFQDEKLIEKNVENLIGDKDIIFLLIGKVKNKNLNNEKNNITSNENTLEDLILSKFSEDSEIIYFEDIKRIKTIISNNTVIKDVIMYPNEIYK
jgi:hypothetical protein